MHLRAAVVFLLIVLCALGVRLAWLNACGIAWSPDSHEYFNLARNLAEGRGYLLDIKFHYFRDFPVRHAGWGERPPLFPLLLALIYKLAGGSAAALFLVNALFPAFAAALGFLVCRKLAVPLLPAALGGLLLSFNPWLFDISLGLHSEQPLIMLTFLFVLLFPSADANPARWLACGFVAGLAMLLRGNGLLLLLTALAYLLYRRPRGLGARLAALLVPYLLLAAIVPYNSWRAHGEPFYDIHASHYCLPAYDIAIWQGFEYPYASATTFIAGNLPLVVSQLTRNAAKYATDLCDLWLGAFFVPLLLFVPWRGPGARQAGVLAAVALLNYLIVVSFWSVYAARFLIPVVAVLIPLALRGGQAAVGRMRAMLPLYGLVVLLLFGWRLTQYCDGYIRRAAHGPHAPAVYATAQNLPASAIVAATDPWVVANVARVPAAIIPEFQDRAQLDRWLAKYGFTHIVLDRQYTGYGRAFADRWLPELVRDRRAILMKDDGRLIYVMVVPAAALVHQIYQ